MEDQESEFISTIGDHYSDVNIEIYKAKYGAKFILKNMSKPKLELQFFLGTNKIDDFTHALKDCGTFSQSPDEEQLYIREKLKNYDGNNNCEKMNNLIGCYKHAKDREKKIDELYRKILREKQELEYREKRIKDLFKTSGEIIEGTELQNMEIEDAIKRLLNERRRAQMALAGVFDADT